MTKLFLAVFLFTGFTAFCQADSSKAVTSKSLSLPVKYRSSFRDSATLARYLAKKDSLKSAKDSVLAYQDSVRIAWFKPLRNRPNKFTDSLIKLYKVENFNFSKWSAQFPKPAIHYNAGTIRAKGEAWVFYIIMLLVLFLAILNLIFPKEIFALIHAFYVGHSGKEENLFSSRPFMFFYILFGFTGGMLLYLSSRYFQINYYYTGFNSYIILSLVTLVLFTGKILVLKALAFLFDFQSLVKEYVSILCLTYFNAALLLLPLIIAFSLAPLRQSIIYIYLSIAGLAVVLAIYFFRIGVNILSKYKFSKTYLFIYLCALEVCPLLVLIKALRF